ncbi:hypothetical protein BC941DRAFT_444648 [Chlamydoabsidia padenii]|nr:hypothetical protein BC941DRAFT_444648 [Chlamydoabsidia padenii]
MGARSVGRTLDAIKYKWEILIRNFKYINDAIRRNGSGGLPGQQQWAYYDAMLDILREDPNVFPVVELDSLRPESLVNLLEINEDEEDEVDQEGGKKGSPSSWHFLLLSNSNFNSSTNSSTSNNRRRQRLTGGIRDSVVASLWTKGSCTVIMPPAYSRSSMKPHAKGMINFSLIIKLSKNEGLGNGNKSLVFWSD